MELTQLLKNLAPFKFFIFLILIILDLSIYYASFDSFSYATKKEDSPANLQAAVVRGIIILCFSVAITVFIIWLYMQKW